MAPSAVGILAEVGDRVRDGSLIVAAPIALAAGLVSFLSPCVLPLVPGYVSFVTGLSGAELAATDAHEPRRVGRVLIGVLGFIGGFTFVFVSFGALFGGLGNLIRDHADTLTRIFGVVTIALGLSFMGVFGAGSFLGRDVRVHKAPKAGIIGAPLLGAAFAFGWTPCIGPTLAAVLNLAASDSNATAARGALLSLSYCIGLGLPFVITGLAFERSARLLGVVKRHARVVTVVGGVMLVTVGVLQVTGGWTWFVEWLQNRFGGVELPI
jgi:cytochrome c-type biogenesis protein